MFAFKLPTDKVATPPFFEGTLLLWAGLTMDFKK